MSRYRKPIIWVVVVVLAVVGVFYAIGRQASFNRAMPAWLNPQQPPDGVAAELSTLTAAQSFAANGCPSMTACCADRTAGARVRRTYPGSLAGGSGSFIQLRAQVGT